MEAHRGLLDPSAPPPSSLSSSCSALEARRGPPANATLIICSAAPSHHDSQEMQRLEGERKDKIKEGRAAAIESRLNHPEGTEGKGRGRKRKAGVIKDEVGLPDMDVADMPMPDTKP